jgi:hypothetical protein
MGWRVWDAYEREAHERWKALPKAGQLLDWGTPHIRVCVPLMPLLATKFAEPLPTPDGRHAAHDRALDASDRSGAHGAPGHGGDQSRCTRGVSAP